MKKDFGRLGYHVPRRWLRESASTARTTRIDSRSTARLQTTRHQSGRHRWRNQTRLIEPHIATFPPLHAPQPSARDEPSQSDHTSHEIATQEGGGSMSLCTSIIRASVLCASERSFVTATKALIVPSAGAVPSHLFYEAELLS